MKKKVALLVAVMTLLTLTACGGQYKGPCEGCGETKPLYRLTLTVGVSVAGGTHSSSEDLDVCKKCLDALIEETESYQSQGGESVTYSYEKIEK